MTESLSYVLITLLCSSILLFIIFLMAWFTLGKEKYTLIWSLSFIVSTLQWSLVLGQSYIPSHNVYWMLASTCSMISVSMGLWGHTLRTKSKIKLGYFWLLGIAAFATTFYFSVVDLHIGLKMSVYLYYDVILLAFCGIVIFSHRKKSRPAELGATMIYFSFALCLFVAATAALLQGEQVDKTYMQAYLAINFVTLPAAYIGIAFFVVYMLASDLSAKLEELAVKDPLTLCLNRRGFYDSAQKKIVEFHKSQQHVCLIYWDIDRFKSINDKYGHAGGDQVLIETTKRINMNIKTTDIIGRIGGEEFVILIGRASYNEAINVAERLRATLAEKPIKYKEHDIEVTASFGVIDIENDSILIEQAIDSADKALYSAKRDGRNKVFIAKNENDTIHAQQS